MSTRTEKSADGGGLSVTTLVIASVSSIAAALVIHKIWTGGAILGAGLTPIIVAIVSESLKRPTQKFTAIRQERRSRSTVARDTPGDVPVAPPPELERPDPFGIWGADRRSRFHWVRGRPLKIAIATGVLAFAIAAFAVTGAELVFGGSDRGLTYVPGNQGRESTRDDPATTTQPTQTTETAPEEQPTTTAPPTTTTPPTTTVPPTTVPPTAEQPPPGTPPAEPAPEQPAPTPAPTPTPAPQG